MKNSKKLKPNWGITIFYTVIIVIIIGNIILNYNNGVMLQSVFLALYIIAGLMCLISWFKTKNLWSLNFMIFCLLITILFSGYAENTFLKFVISLVMIPVMIIHFYLLIKKRNQWRSSELLELAAKSVNEITDGFTSRPFPVGKLKYSKNDLYQFAKFLKKNMIAFPLFTKNYITFILLDFNFRSAWFKKSNLPNMTYIKFDYSGNMTVKIVKQDYQKFKEELAFDQLCESLGNIFQEFIERYINGEENKIIEKLNEFNENI